MYASVSGADGIPKRARHYELVCSYCGLRQEDDGLILECRGNHPPALLTTRYDTAEFSPRSDQQGLFRYQDWLPVARILPGAGGPVVYRSRGLASVLGMPNLWIAFNGYWPERGARLHTGTFKEYEAYTVLGRLAADRTVLTTASSGNTGAAFAWACSRTRTPCLVLVPKKGLARMRFSEPLRPCVNLVVIDDGDYPDAIALADAVARLPSFQIEGGIRNVGRRDGLATVLLAAYEVMERLPAHYFQAVGSGTGAIAVLEAAKRLARPAGEPLPALRLCQNRPFTPIHDAWNRNPAFTAGVSPQRYRDVIRNVHADELTNWAPPYEVRGGVRDALQESRGDVLTADNAAVVAARRTFLEREGIDIEPAAGVAVACLLDAVANGTVERDAVVLVNITGGGRLRQADDQRLVPAEPGLRVSVKTAGPDTVREIAAMCLSSAASG
ncbi:cysteate synthase [Streptomyces sp. 7R007]